MRTTCYTGLLALLAPQLNLTVLDRSSFRCTVSAPPHDSPQCVEVTLLERVACELPAIQACSPYWLRSLTSLSWIAALFAVLSQHLLTVALSASRSRCWSESHVNY